MANPWEKYQAAAQQGAAPWERYRQGTPAPEPTVSPEAVAAAASTATSPPPDDNALVLPEQAEVQNAAAREAAAQEERSLGEQFLRQAGIAAGGVNRGIAEIAQLPGAALNAAPQLLNLLPGEQGIGPIVEDFNPLVDLVESAGTVEPETRGERVLSRVAEEVGASAVPQAALTARAAQLPRALGELQQLPGVRGALDRIFSAPFRDAPGRANIAESVAAAGAGAGAGLGRELVGDDPTSELTGGILGGLGTSTALGAGSTVGRALRDIVTDSAARQGAGRQLLEAADDPTAVTRAQAQEPIPGVQATTAEATQDPGIAALQQSRAQGTRPATRRRFAERRGQQEEAIRRQVEEQAPAAADDVATRQALQERQVEEQALRRAEAEETEGLREQAPLRETGSEGVARAIGETREEVGTQRREAFRAAREAGDTVVSAEPLRNEVQTVLDDIGPMADTAGRPALSRLVRDIEGIEDDISVADMVDMQPRLSAALRSERASMRGDTVDALMRIDDTMRQQLNDLAEQGDEGALAWQRANQLSAEEAPLFRRGQGGRMDRQMRRDAEPPPSETARQFLRPATAASAGRPEDAQQLRAIIDQAPDQAAANDSVRDYLVGSLGNAVDRSGRPTLDTINRFVRDNQHILREFPDAQREVQQLRNRVQNRSDRIGELESTFLANRYLDRETAAESMGEIMRERRPQEAAKQLRQALEGNEPAIEGARKAFFDQMEASTTGRNALLDREAFVSFVRKNRSVARELLDEGQMRNLEELAAELDGLQKAFGAIDAPRKAADIQEDGGTGLRFNSIMSRIYGIERGAVGARWVTTDVAGRLVNAVAQKFRGRRMNELLDDALLDPDVARALTQEWSQELDRQTTAGLLKALGRQTLRAARPAVTTDEEVGEDEGLGEELQDEGAL